MTRQKIAEYITELEDRFNEWDWNAHSVSENIECHVMRKVIKDLKDIMIDTMEEV